MIKKIHIFGMSGIGSITLAKAIHETFIARSYRVDGLTLKETKR